MVDGLLEPIALTATTVMLYLVSGWRFTRVCVVTVFRVVLASYVIVLSSSAVAKDTITLSIDSPPSKPSTHEMVMVVLVVLVY